MIYANFWRILFLSHDERFGEHFHHGRKEWRIDHRIARHRWPIVA